MITMLYAINIKLDMKRSYAPEQDHSLFGVHFRKIVFVDQWCDGSV